MADGRCSRTFPVGPELHRARARGLCGRARPSGGPGARPGVRSEKQGNRRTPCRAAGVRTCSPRFENIIIYMQENQLLRLVIGCCDRVTGLLQSARHVPTNRTWNIEGPAMSPGSRPSTCQLGLGVSQSWTQPLQDRDGGRIGRIPLRTTPQCPCNYWGRHGLPLYYSLADVSSCVRPVVRVSTRADVPKPHCTSGRDIKAGLVSTDNCEGDFAIPHPAGGAVWDKLDAHGIRGNGLRVGPPGHRLFPENARCEQGQDPDRSRSSSSGDCHDVCIALRCRSCSHGVNRTQETRPTCPARRGVQRSIIKRTVGSGPPTGRGRPTGLSYVRRHGG